MNNRLQQALSAAVIALLRPLVKILLSNGIAYGTFAELARKVYVDVAFDEMDTAGRPTVSSVSALTGLTRKETKRLRELSNLIGEQSGDRYNRAIRVISGWSNNPRFQDSKGQPALLPLEGEDISFASLVRDYSGDIPVSAMLKVLESAACISVDNKQVKLIRDAYIPQGAPIEKIRILGSDVAELIATIEHNLNAPTEQLLFQRKVSNTAIKPEAIAAFKKYSAKKSQALLEDFYRWLAKHEVEPDSTNERGQYVAVGIYYTEHSAPKESES